MSVLYYIIHDQETFLKSFIDSILHLSYFYIVPEYSIQASSSDEYICAFQEIDKFRHLFFGLEALTTLEIAIHTTPKTPIAYESFIQVMNTNENIICLEPMLTTFTILTTGVA